jgi:hypothetical protein
MISKLELQNMDITFDRWELRNPDNVRLKLADPGSQGEAEISRMAIVFTMHHALWWCFLVRKLSSSWEAAGKPASKGKREKNPPKVIRRGSALEQFWDDNLHVWEANPNLLEFQNATKWHSRPNHLHLIIKAVNFNQATHSISKMQPPYPWQK